ncbi:MAG: TonB-dependent receptor, partial [Betaproteobacteria bacterium]|nr:TonB-dependent receptor [Betaproteobacteria bacterium]
MVGLTIGRSITSNASRQSPVYPQLKPLVAALLGVSLSTVQAQDSSSTKDIGVVIVSSGRPSSLPTVIPTTMEGISAKEIQERINAMDSEDVLKYFPSLLVRKRYIGDYNHAMLSSRASGTGNPARSMVFADGMLLSNYLGNSVSGLSFPPRWSMVTPSEIERVDVMYGPYSAAYAGNSAGAVVEFVTRMPSSFEAHAQASYVSQPFDLYNTDQSFRAWRSDLSLGDRVGAFSWLLAASRLDSTGQPQTFATRTLS